MSQLLYLSREDVSRCGLQMSDVLDAVEHAYLAHGLGRTVAPPKLGVHMPEGEAFLHAMPALVSEPPAVGVKWVSSFPSNRDRSLPNVTGLIILNDPETGLPKAVMDGSWITAMRTGAVSAVAARRLSRPDARVLGVLGCGVQGRTNLLALREVLPLEAVRAYDPDEAAAARYVTAMTEETELRIQRCSTPEEAVTEADVVVTAGPLTRQSRRTVVPEWLAEGSLLITVDYDSSVDPRALASLDILCTDDVPQLLSARERGHFPDLTPIHADLGELVAGRKPGRTGPRQRTGIVHLGLAICDVAVAARVLQRARERGIGTMLPA